MPSAFTHAFVALAAGYTCYGRRMPLKFWILAPVCAAAPDLDAGLFAYGVQHEDLWGHRGMTHSLFFAAIFAIIVMAVWFRRQPPAAPFTGKWWGLLAFFFLIIAAHGFLDAFTNGGLGIAFFSPFDTTRYFFPWTPIEVAPIGISNFLSRRGYEVMRSEFLWIWLPVIALAIMGMIAKSITRRASA